MTLARKIIKTAISKKISNRDIFFALAKKMASAEKTTPPRISVLRQTYLNLIAKRRGSQGKNPPQFPSVSWRIKGGSRGSLPFKKGELERDFLNKILQKRGVRTLSGVAIITVLTKPWPCPGKCVYCPIEARMPKSYLSNEPAASRALGLKFDPYKQVYERIKVLEANGHPTDKIELIVKGGTWSAYPWKYQQWFINECFRACNTSNAKIKMQNEKLQFKIQNLLRTQKKNETAKHRIVGITLETRPDWITPEEILRLRALGCTRVEMGVQTTDEKILKKIKRGHDLEQVKTATALLKNAGFKVDYHLMPMLPGATPGKDFKMFKEIFSNPDLRPDMIKIYPCTVVKGSLLYHWWKRKIYKPYSDKKLLELLIKVKSKIIPRYCRISRLIRDIPSTSIEAGNRMTNLRELIKKEMEKRGLKCKCLRCREVGHQKNEKCKMKNAKLFIDKYRASGGVEYFLSIEDTKRNVVYAFCRLRLPKNPPQSPFDPPTGGGERKGDLILKLSDTAFIRELHTYGHLVSLKSEIRNPKSEISNVQHTGLGKQLMHKAEEIARLAGYKKWAVISGVGVREYYRKLGFRLENTYMVKYL